MEDDDGLTGTLGGSGAGAGVTSEPTAPPREEFVQNAVAFLKHPQVSTSPEHSKRAFLEKKGLSESEIQEAFKHVPQGEEGSAKDSNAGGSAGTGKTIDNTSRQPEKSEPLRWTQVVARTGAAIAALSYAYKIVRPKSDGSAPPPRSGPGLSNSSISDSAATRAAVTAAAHAEHTSAALQEAVAAATEAKRDAADARARAVAAEIAAEAHPTLNAHTIYTAKDVSNALEAAKRDLRVELEQVVAKAMAEATRGRGDLGNTSISGNTNPIGSLATPEFMCDGNSDGVQRELAAIKAMLASSPLVSANAGVTGNVGDYAGDFETFETDDGYQNSSSSRRVTPRMRAEDTTVVPPPGTTPRSALASSSKIGTGGNAATGTPSMPFGDRFSGGYPSNQSPPSTPKDPPHPASYKDVIDMLDKGLTPPGIRDIDDKPPDPTVALPPAQLSTKKKPWEGSDSASSSGAWPLGGMPKGPSEGGAKPWQPRGGTSSTSKNSAAAVPWQPPSVPSMSSEAEKVLFGKAGDGKGTLGGENNDTFGGFDSPVPSGSAVGS